MFLLGQISFTQHIINVLYHKANGGKEDVGVLSRRSNPADRLLSKIFTIWSKQNHDRM